MSKLKNLIGAPKRSDTSAHTSSSDLEAHKVRPRKWAMGMLNDRETDEVPGT